MFRILLLLLTVLMIDFTAINAQSVTGTFRNSVNTTPVGDGTLSLFNISAQQWVFQGATSGHQTMIFSDTDYRIHTDQYRLTINNMFYKHHYWDQQVQEYKLHSDFNVSQAFDEVTKTADFTGAQKTTLFNNFEEFTDEGLVHFRDPWYVDANNQQTGNFETFPSPHVPTGAYGEQEAAVFLEKLVWPNQPYYSLNFHSFLQGDYTTPTSAPLTSDDWVFIGAFAREAGDVQLTLQDQDSYWVDNGGLWQRESEYAVDIEFRKTDSELFGFYKRHRHSSSENEPTAINSQRKVVMERLAYPNRRFHQIYESDGKIYHTWSEDDGASWEGEVMLSVFDHHCVQPVIDVSKYETGKPCLLSAAWIDESENKLILAQRFVTERPTAWTIVDAIDLTSASPAHPTLNVRLFEGHYFTVLIWVQGQDLMYSVYRDGAVLVGERIQGTSQPQSATFNALILETVPAIRTPKYPTLILGDAALFDGIEGGVAWSERPREVLRYKGLKISSGASRSYI